jgi:predicted nucleic acid-binding protein
VDRIFLDANVLFSAAYRPGTDLLRLWNKPVQLLTSEYAATEARINLPEEAQRIRLAELLRRVRVMASHPTALLPDDIDLPEKDRPILLAAIQANATHLLTGDKQHFGRYFGRRLAGVLILSPSEYLRSRG